MSETTSLRRSTFIDNGVEKANRTFVYLMSSLSIAAIVTTVIGYFIVTR